MTTKQIKNSTIAPDGSLYVTVTDGAGNLTGGSSGITVGTSVVTSGTSGALLYDAAGVVGETSAAQMAYSVPTSATGTLTINTSTRTKSNRAILGNNSIVVKNSAFGTASINILNRGDTNQPSAATFSIVGGADGSQQIFTNESMVYPADYVNATTYAKGDVVNGSDGFAYTSQAAGNQGHDPTTDGPTFTHWKTNSNVSANGIFVYDDPLQNWNGIELGQAGLQLWIGPKSTGNIGGELETPVGAFMLTAWDDTNHIPITTMGSKTTFTKGVTTIVPEGPAYTATISTGNVNGYLLIGKTGASGATMGLFSNNAAGWFGTQDNFPVYVFTNDQNPSMKISTAGGLWVGAPNGSPPSPAAGTIDAGVAYQVAETQVVSSRKTGWTVATGTPQRTTFATSTVTLAQLAGVVMALEQDLISHGLIGA